MGSPASETCGWSVFDGVKAPLPPTPEALMAKIDAAIATSEHASATTLLSSLAAQAAVTATATAVAEDHRSNAAGASTATYDARLADEAYKASCAALTAGRPDAALRSLNVALTSCPPERTSALAKLRSLVSIASSQQQKQQQSQR